MITNTYFKPINIFSFCLTTFLLICTSCAQNRDGYDEASILEKQQSHENSRMQFKLIQSQLQSQEEIFHSVAKDIQSMTEESYKRLSAMVIENDMAGLRQLVEDEAMTFEELTLFYLYRMYKYETDPRSAVHTIISIHPHALPEARLRDSIFTTVEEKSNLHPLFGMPILLKDNINTDGIPTTAGAAILQYNQPPDAELVSHLKANGAIILGKTNLSEWAYYFCSGCPLGYSAVGGQTLNPFGRLVFETGGSSSGSGVAATLNYAAGTIGTETSGSILSPSSQNSIVGLKPTVGQISQEGIVPISKTLDTAGPMCKTVCDTWVLYHGMKGSNQYEPCPKPLDLSTVTIGIPISLLEDSLFTANIDVLKNHGAQLIVFEPDSTQLDGFITLLNQEMKTELPKYMEDYGQQDDLRGITIADVIAYNLQDSIVRSPYGQGIFEGIVKENVTESELNEVRERLMSSSTQYFERPEKTFGLDVIISINNYHAGFAALAHRPCLTIPMGFKSNGEPANITLIGQTNQDESLFPIGRAIEGILKGRHVPKAYP